MLTVRMAWKWLLSHEHKSAFWDFPCGPVLKNPPSNSGDVGSTPGWGTKTPHAIGQLSPCATTSEHKGHN